MDLSVVKLDRIDFPGAAGAYQRAGRTSALVRELGDNYATYHAFLAGRLARFGRRPRRDDFDTEDQYLEAWGEIYAIVSAEAALRSCRRFRKEGGPLAGPADIRKPLVDPDTDALVSIE